MRLSVLLFICFSSCIILVNGQPGSYDSLGQHQYALLGGQGLINIPIAHTSGNRSLSFGVSELSSEASFLEFSRLRDANDRLYFVNMGFLPFLDVTLKVTKPSHEDHFGIGDRSLFLKMNVLKETDKRPALSIGLHDPFKNGFYHAAYIVATKHFIVGKKTYLALTTGYGNRLNTAQNYYLEGAFAGAALKFNFLSANVELESKQINLALKASIFKKFNFNVAVLNGKALAGSFLFSTKI